MYNIELITKYLQYLKGIFLLKLTGAMIYRKQPKYYYIEPNIIII